MVLDKMTWLNYIRQMPVDNMTLRIMQVVKMPGDKIPIDKMPVDKIPIDKMQVNKMPV